MNTERATPDQLRAMADFHRSTARMFADRYEWSTAKRFRELAASYERLADAKRGDAWEPGQ